MARRLAICPLPTGELKEVISMLSAVPLGLGWGVGESVGVAEEVDWGAGVGVDTALGVGVRVAVRVGG